VHAGCQKGANNELLSGQMIKRKRHTAVFKNPQPKYLLNYAISSIRRTNRMKWCNKLWRCNQKGRKLSRKDKWARIWEIRRGRGVEKWTIKAITLTLYNAFSLSDEGGTFEWGGSGGNRNYFSIFTFQFFYSEGWDTMNKRSFLVCVYPSAWE